MREIDKVEDFAFVDFTSLETKEISFTNHKTSGSGFFYVWNGNSV